MKKTRLVVMAIYTIVYYVLLFSARMHFSYELATIFIINIISLLIGFNFWLLRVICYVGVLGSLLSNGGDSLTTALIKSLIFGWGFLGLLIEFFSSNPSDEQINKAIQIGFEICPHCKEKIKKTATKCPYCTKDLNFK